MVGATVRVDALPDLVAVTDSNGFFRLENVPAPEFAVHIDGSTATNAPAGTVYATVGKIFESVPGTEIQLTQDGSVFDVFLPTIAESDIQDLSATEDTEVGIGSAGVAQLQELFPEVEASTWELLGVTFPAGSAQDEEGNVATGATIIPVEPNRLPAPLPPGVDPQLVISIQAGGATNFDVPAPVTFPNFDGLAPGEQSLIWSFNHDSGKFEVIGTGTVSEDGLRVVSDPGVGIFAPGWHFTQPGVQHEEMPERDDCEGIGDNALTALRQGLAAIASGISAVSGTIDILPWENIPLAGYVLDSKLNIISLLTGIAADYLAQGEVSDGTRAQALALYANLEFGWIPSVGWIASTPVDIASAGIGWNAYSQQANKGSEAFNNFTDQLFDCLDQEILQPIAEAFERIGQYIGDLAERVIDGVVSSAEDIINFIFEFGDALIDEITEERRSELEKKLDRADRALEDLKQSGENTIREIIRNEVPLPVLPPSEIPLPSIEKLKDYLFNVIGQITSPAVGAFYSVETTSSQVLARGILNDSGSWNAVLPSNRLLQVSYYDPVTSLTWQDFILTGNSGSSSQERRLIVQQSAVDSDNDGLPDIAEAAIGTASDNFDTDGDGISDIAEIEQGLDPLGDRGFPTGIIASLPLQGEANAVVVEGDTLNEQNQTAYVATGSHGLAIIDAGQFNNPIVLGQLDLAGDATDIAVDPNLQIAAVATNSGGLQLVDVSDPMVPILSRAINISVNQVEIFDGIAYATVGTSLRAIDLLTGEELHNTTLPGSGTVTGLAREGTNLYAFASGGRTLSVIDIAQTNAINVIGQFNVQISDIVSVFAANDIVYLGGAGFATPNGLVTIDVSDPTAPTLISGPDQFFDTRALALNGSGIALIGSEIEGRGVGIYNVADPTDTNNFITQIAAPGRALSIAIASGIAYVASDTGGLAVINYLPFDNQGQTPSISITSAVDVDPNSEGVQVTEGGDIPIGATVADDVQVRNVELLVNGEVASNDVSFPFELRAIALSDDPDATTVEVQARATDTGGNVALSNPLTFELVPDTFAPLVQSTTPTADISAINVSAFTITFNEALDTTIVDPSGITVLNLGEDGENGGDDDTSVTIQTVETPSERRLVILPNAPLETFRTYQVTLDPSIIQDRAGNPLESAFSFQFANTVEPGNSREDAPIIDVVTSPKSFTNIIDSNNPVDYYRLELPEGDTSYDFNLTLDGLSANAGVRILDSNQNTVLQSSYNDTEAKNLSLFLTPGTYFIQIIQGSSMPALYNLTIQANAM